MSLQGRWVCSECPWGPCSQGPWKRHNSSYVGEDCSGLFALVCVSLSSFQLDSLHCGLLNTADHIARSSMFERSYSPLHWHQHARPEVVHASLHQHARVIIELGLVVGETYPPAHRQEDCRVRIMDHLATSGNHSEHRAVGLDPEVAALECNVQYEECLHVAVPLLLERSCSPLTSV
jgi:hypothetical protein